VEVVKDIPYPLDKEKAMSRMLEPAVSPIDAAIERIVKIIQQVNRKLITEGDAEDQFLRILVTFKMEVIKDTFGDLQDKLSDIEQMFSEVRDSVEEADFLTLFKPE
jgi:archaellum component FlaC